MNKVGNVEDRLAVATSPAGSPRPPHRCKSHARRHPEHQACCRHDAVVRTQDGLPKPADALQAVLFPMEYSHSLVSLRGPFSTILA